MMMFWVGKRTKVVIEVLIWQVLETLGVFNSYMSPQVLELSLMAINHQFYILVLHVFATLIET